MLDKAVLEQLANFKLFEELKINIYTIKLKYLTLGHILSYQKELESINKEDRNIMKFVQEFEKLSDSVIEITDKDNKPVRLKDLPIALSIPIATEWMELNFTNGNLMVAPLEQMLGRLTGKPVNLKKLLESLSAVLSAAGTLGEEKSSN